MRVVATNEPTPVFVVLVAAALFMVRVNGEVSMCRQWF
jgi:hypothetical protein